MGARCLKFYAPHLHDIREGSGSISLLNGSGSGRPKNMRILRIRIRIPNTGKNCGFSYFIIERGGGLYADAARRSHLCRSLTRPRHHGLSQGGTPLQVGGQVYQWCGSGMFIPDPDLDFTHPGARIQGRKDSGSASKNLRIFNPKNCFQALGNMTRDVYHGYGS